MRAVIICLPLVALMACNAPETVNPGAAIAPTLGAKSGTIRIYVPTGNNVVDVPFYMALNTLKAQGYTVEENPIARFDLVTAALAKGDIDFAHTSNPIAWAAIAKNAPIVTLMSANSNPYWIVANQNIKTCSDLNGKRVALPATTGFIPVMLNEYIKSKCPGARPEIVVMSGDRYPGLLSGNLDASTLELTDWLELEAQAPGRFHPLVKFAEEFPQIDITAYFVRRDWAAAHPEMVKDFLRAVLAAHRRIQDKQILENAVVTISQLERTRAKSAAEVYLAQKIWNVNGGLTPQRVQFMLDFLAQNNALPAGLQAAQVLDASYLNAVLGEIGTK